LVLKGLVVGSVAARDDVTKGFQPAQALAAKQPRKLRELQRKLLGVAIKPGDEKLSPGIKKTLDEIKAKIGPGR
jgi:hypothetical protein